MSPSALHRARRLLCSLQDHIRDALLEARRRSSSDFSRIADVTEADTIYQIDKVTEDVILAWFDGHWPKTWPVELVMEGLEGKVTTFPRGTPVAKTRWKCILDPIDGTREIMYDKRSAWSLAALAPQRGARTNLTDLVVAAMTELPTSKQWRSDQISAVRGAGPRGVRAEWVDVRAGGRGPLTLRPSRAKDFKHGFSALVRFFPHGKGLLSQLEEDLWAEIHADVPPGSPLVFDDQYISTGGQLYEILAGHDRFLADLRPEAHARLGLSSNLACHPYDICTALIATELGAVVEAPLGGPVKAPLDTVSPVSWVAFANPALAKKMRPVLRRLIRERLRPAPAADAGEVGS
ncbi:inositol monophosphatase [Opitutaceae bacterium EW11]|nr:inositol monophosphatase [Opitutaceae bacterium EW11]